MLRNQLKKFNTFDWLQLPEIMNHLLNVGQLRNMCQSLWQILQDHSSIEVRIFVPKGDALVTEASAYIYKQSS